MRYSDFLLANQPLYPLRFAPVYKDYLWGGNRLRARFGRSLPQAFIAESWEIADHPNGESVVLNGPLRRRTLNELVRARCQDLLGEDVARRRDCDRFPLILKYLDAKLPLSVQVHPDDETAADLNLGDGGKTEAWVIVDAEPESKLWLGTDRNYSKAELERAIQSGELEHCLHSVPVKVGDCFFLPSGTLHALGAGIMVVEVQTNSDLTLRLFDWNRVGPDGKPRELKIAEALRSLRLPCGPIKAQPSFSSEHRNCERLLICEQFMLNRWTLSEPMVWSNDDRAHLWTVLEGTATAIFNAGRRIAPKKQSGRESDPDAIEVLRKGDSILAPAMCPGFHWITEGGEKVTLLDAVVT